ncbi:hypothetical protein ACFQ9X_17340 [Catenulispora yoronensis]
MTCEYVTLHAESTEPGGPVEFSYEIPLPQGQVESLLSDTRPFVDWRIGSTQVASCEFSADDQGRLVHAVNLVPVGGIGRTTETAPILPLDAPAPLPSRSVGGSSHNPALELARLAVDELRELVSSFAPRGRFTVPVPAVLPRRDRSSAWRTLCAFLEQNPGCVRITMSRFEPENDDTHYARLCLLYSATTGPQLSAGEPDLLTARATGIPTMQGEVVLRGPVAGLAAAVISDLGDGTVARSATAVEKMALTVTDERLKRVLHRLERAHLTAEAVDLLCPPYSTDQALPGVRHFQPSPFNNPYVQPPAAGSDDSILLGRLSGGGAVWLSIDELSKHTFVTGVPGSGKTTTMMRMAEAVNSARPQVPLLLIDPAKSDFRPLMKRLRLEHHIIDFTADRYPRFNPFIPPENGSVYDHCVRVAKPLALLFPTTAAGYSILLELIRRLYWEQFFPGGSPATLEELRAFARLRGTDITGWPTFEGFLERGPRLLEDLLTSSAGPFSDRSSQFQVEAYDHFNRRFESLRRSIVRLMFNPADPDKAIYDLFRDTYLIEFGRIADREEVDCAISLIFALLYGYRVSEDERAERNTDRPADLAHLAFIDEAHRIIPALPSGGDRPRVFRRRGLYDLREHDRRVPQLWPRARHRRPERKSGQSQRPRERRNDDRAPRGVRL